MATTIKVEGDTIVITKTFKKGKDLIKLNGNAVFEGKLEPGTPQEFTDIGRTFVLDVGANKKTFHLTIHEDGELLHDSLHDQMGQPVRDEAHAKANSKIQTLSLTFALIGCAVMIGLNKTTKGAVPGGAIGGAIGGGVGGMIGFGIGSLLFGVRKE